MTRIVARRFGWIIVFLSTTSTAQAVTDTWDGNSPNGGIGDSNISTGLNWADDTAPASDLLNTDLIFAGTTKLTPNFSAIFSANSVTFNNNAAANAFTFSGSALTIGTGGITNNDGNLETFNNTVSIGTATSTFNAANAGLSFTTLALGANALTFNGTGASIFSTITGSGSFTKNGGNISYGPAGAMTQAWDLVENSGALVTVLPSTDLTVSTTGSITVSGATFNAAGNVTMDATPLLLSGGSSSATVQSGKTLTLQNGASLTSSSVAITHNSAGTITATGSGTVVNAGTNALVVNGSTSTLNVQAGADATFSSMTIGGTTTATVLIDGAGSTATGTSSSTTIGNGFTGVLTFSNSAVGSLGSVNLATSSSSNGQFNIQSGASVTSGSVLMVDDAVAGETGTLTVNGAGSTFTISAAGTLTIGAASLSTASLNVQNSGVFNTGTGTTTLNTTGGINITGGTFTANGNLTLNGGDLSRDATGVLNIASGKTLTTQNGSVASFAGVQNFGGVNLTVTGASSAIMTTSGNLNINGGATVNISAGGHLDSASGMNIGNLGVGTHTITVDGAGSQLSTAAASTWGAFGGVVNATFSNSAVGSFGSNLSLGSSFTAGSAGTVMVQSGADVTSGQLTIGNTAAASTSGSVTVTGAGSTWTILGANSLGVGAASGSTGSLTVASGGVFNSSIGNSVINATGTLALNGGTFVANGGLTVDGGQFTRSTTGTFTLPLARTLSVQNGGDAIFTGSYTNSTASIINVSGLGSMFSTTSFTFFSGGVTLSVTDGGTLSIGGTGIEFEENSVGTVDGVGSTLTSSTLFIGNINGQNSLTFSNGSTGAFNVITMLTSPSTADATLNIQSGSVVTSASLELASHATGNSGLVSITDAGSALTLTGAATTEVGAVNTNTARLDVLNGGTFTSGTGTVTLNATGTINIDAGTVNLLGTLVRNGGTVNFTAGSLSIIDNWNVGAGGLLGTNVTFDATRRMTTTATTTIDAFRTLTLNGGTLSTGALANNGTIAFNSGTLAVTGAGGFTIGSGTALGANVTLGTGANLQVTNTATVASGATLTLNGGSFTAGTLNVNSTLRANLGAVSATGGTNNSGGRIFVADTLNISGALTNASGGKITLENGAGLLSGAGTLSNSGLITGDGTIAKPLTNGATGEVRGESGRTLAITGAAINSGSLNLLGGTLDFASTVTNNATGFISGHGALFTGGLTNSGQMAFAGSTDIRGDVTLTAGARVATSGAGSATTFYDDVVHNGLEIFTGAGASTVFYGDQSGAGPFTGTGTVYYIGDLRPGNSPANVPYAGNLVFGGAASLNLEIGGITPGSEYDRLTIAGTASIDGALDVSLINGFTPTGGQQFTILTAGSIVNNGFILGGPGASSFSLIVNSTSVILQAIGLAGDYNNDGKVDAADYIVWRKNQGTTNTLPNDPIGGTIGTPQYNQWRAHFGQPGGSGAGAIANAVVPEPATLVLLILASVGCCLRRGRNA